jgi:hypothetical protein
MPRPCLWLSRQSPSYLPPPRNIKPIRPPPKHPQAPVSHRPASTHSHALTQPPPRANTTCPLPSAAQAREPCPAITYGPTRLALSQARTPLPRPHPPRPHAGSCSPAACCHAAPATTPTPHSPFSAEPGADASSVEHAIEPLALVGIAVGELFERELPVSHRRCGPCCSW